MPNLHTITQVFMIKAIRDWSLIVFVEKKDTDHSSNDNYYYYYFATNPIMISTIDAVANSLLNMGYVF